MGGEVAQVTVLLRAWRGGDRDALEPLMSGIYDELRRIARACLTGERPGHTLQASALVNEAFLRLAGLRQIDWQDRVHFFAVAARMMRRVLVDHARARAYQKRGAGVRCVQLDELAVPAPEDLDLVRLDDALTALEQHDPRKARVVELRYFAGLSVAETAAALDVSTQTVQRDWTLAKSWLLRELSRQT